MRAHALQCDVGRLETAAGCPSSHRLRFDIIARICVYLVLKRLCLVWLTLKASLRAYVECSCAWMHVFAHIRVYVKMSNDYMYLCDMLTKRPGHCRILFPNKSSTKWINLRCAAVPSHILHTHTNNHTHHHHHNIARIVIASAITRCVRIYLNYICAADN